MIKLTELVEDTPWGSTKKNVPRKRRWAAKQRTKTFSFWVAALAKLLSFGKVKEINKNAEKFAETEEEQQFLNSVQQSYKEMRDAYDHMIKLNPELKDQLPPDLFD